MGVIIPNCCKINNFNESKDQIFFKQGHLFYNEEITDDKEKENNNYLLSGKGKIDLEKAKINFGNIIKYYGEILENKKIEDILEESNLFIKDIEFPQEIVDYSAPNCFISPPIRFNNGEIYQGSWNISNQRHGFGINISPEGNIFKGLWNQDKMGSYGLLLDSKGNYYKGDLKDGKCEGKGEMVVREKSKYVGTFENDYPNGKGILENYENKTKYDGDFVNGKKEGKGVMEYEDGTVYEGDFKNDQFEGNGVLKFPNGNKYEGEFHGIIHGKGKFTWGDGKTYIGQYEDFMRKGFGKFYWNDNKYYEGQWLNNKQHGKGIIHYDGKEVNGLFRFGKIIKENKIE